MTIYPSEYIECACTLGERFARTAHRATLPNGKATVAFFQKAEAHLMDEVQVGDVVKVRICPADFDRARVLSLLSVAE